MPRVKEIILREGMLIYNYENKYISICKHRRQVYKIKYKNSFKIP